MSARYHIDTVLGEDPEIHVRIKFAYFPPSGDGWKEPREPHFVEFTSATAIDAVTRRPIETTPDIVAQAEEWFDDHHVTALEHVADEEIAGQEWRAEQRREMWRDSP